MTDQQLQAIEDRWAKATPGPWQYEERENDDGMNDCHCVTSGVIDYTFGYDMEEYDAQAIASAPTDISLLLAEVRRLRCCGNCRKQQYDGMDYFCDEDNCEKYSKWEAAK